MSARVVDKRQTYKTSRPRDRVCEENENPDERGEGGTYCQTVAIAYSSLLATEDGLYPH